MQTARGGILSGKGGRDTVLVRVASREKFTEVLKVLGCGDQVQRRQQGREKPRVLRHQDV